MSRDRVLFFVALAFFLGLTSYQLALPGIHYDEAFEAVPAMQILLGQPVTTFRENGMQLVGRLFPFMTQDYIGAVNTYAVIPFFLLLGISPLALRVMAIVIGALTLWFTYRLAEALYGTSVAALSTLLLAVNPTFVFWSRQGVFVTSATAAIGLGTVLMWLYWWRTGARRYALAGAFLLGFGLYAKLLFLWLIIALCIAVILLNLSQMKLVLRRLGHGQVGWVGLAFLLGCAPLVLYNLQTGGTFRSVGQNLITSYYGTNNLALLTNLLERLRQFVVVLLGSHFWYLGGVYANWLNLGVFLAALAITIICLATSRNRSRAGVVLFPFIVIAGVILASCVTVSALWLTHFALVAPWPPLAIAAAVGLFVRGSRLLLPKKGQLIAVLLALVLVGVLWLAEVFTDVRYHRALAFSGGLGAHSDAVEDLAHWLVADERRGTPVAAMDWGIAAPTAFLTRGQVTPVEAFGYAWEADQAFVPRLEQFIDNPASIYLWRAPDEIIFDRSDDFQQLYKPRGLEEDILEAFYERSGRPVLGATHLVPKGAATNPVRPLDRD